MKDEVIIDRKSMKIESIDKVSEFTSYEDFMDWYTASIRQYVPRYDAYVAMGRGEGGSDKVHTSMPRLTKEQVAYTTKKIREVIKFPKKIRLSYRKSATTWFCRYHEKKGFVIIAFPTCAYFWTKFPELLVGAVTHELGHIFNGDLSVFIKGHSDCLNICMDIRINDNIERKTLMRINDCLFHFKIKKIQRLLNSEDQFEDIGLDPEIPATYEEIHNHYHQYGDKDEKEQEEVKAPPLVLQEGQVVVVNSGTDAGEIGKVSGVKGDEDTYYKVLENPRLLENTPDMLKDVRYEVESVAEYVKIYFTTKLQSSLPENFNEIVDLASSFKPTTIGEYEVYQLTPLSPAQDDINEPPPPPPPPDEEEPKETPREPQLGDVIKLTKGKNKDKYGVIKNIELIKVKDPDKDTEDVTKKYQIELVPVSVVNAILGTDIKE